MFAQRLNTTGKYGRPIIATAVEAMIDRGHLSTANSKEGKFVSLNDLNGPESSRGRKKDSP
jgi:hypothetical protein